MAVDLDASPAYVLIRGIGAYPPDLIGGNFKGYIANVSDSDHRAGPNGPNTAQQPPNWIQVKITDATVRQCLKYLEQWETIIDYEILPGNPAEDYHNIRAYVIPSEVSLTKQNNLTRDQVENYINAWGGTVQSAEENSVYFGVSVFAALTSPRYWERSVLNFEFTETYYDQATGEHRILVDVSGLSIDIQKIAGYVINQGCTIVGQVEENQLTFSCFRNSILNRFKADIKQCAHKIIAKRKWYLKENAVNAIINAGGILDAPAALALNYMYSRIEND